jgi:hypothetical protein
VRARIARLEQRQRDLEHQFLFAEAAKVHAEAIQIAKQSMLPKEYVRKLIASQRTFELLPTMSREDQEKYLASATFLTVAPALMKQHNMKGAKEAQEKMVKILRSILPQDDVIRLVAEIDLIYYRAQIEPSTELLVEIAALQSRCSKILGENNDIFAVLVDAELTINEKQNKWIAAIEKCEHLEKILIHFGADKDRIIANRNRIALNQLKAGKLQPALHSSLKALADSEANDGHNKPQFILAIYVTRARILMATGDLLGAESFFEKARSAASVLREGVLPEDYLRFFRDTYAECLIKLGKIDEAAQLKVDGAFP